MTTRDDYSREHVEDIPDVMSRLRELIHNLDRAARFASGYQPNKGMFWYSVANVEIALNEIRFLQARYLTETSRSE